MSSEELWTHISSGSSDGLSKDILKATFGHLMCSICDEPMFSPFIIKCGHSFCYTCSTAWFEKSRTCPICRTKVYEAPVLNHGLKEILGGMFEKAVAAADDKTKKKLVALKDEKEEDYQQDLAQKRALFGGVFDIGKYSHVTVEDGCPRCSNCLWEARGKVCLYCNSRFINPPPSDNDDDSDLDMSDDDDDDIVVSHVRGDISLTSEQSAGAVQAAARAFVAGQRARSERASSDLLELARQLNSSDDEEDESYSDHDDHDVSDGENTFHADDFVGFAHPNVNPHWWEYAETDSESEDDDAVSPPTRQRHVPRAGSVDGASDSDSEDDNLLSGRRGQNWRIHDSSSESDW